jgi:hypothetical protein
MLRQYNDRVERERRERDKLLSELHDRYGLRVPPGSFCAITKLSEHEAD